MQQENKEMAEWLRNCHRLIIQDKIDKKFMTAEWLRSSHLSITPGHAGGWPGDYRPLYDNRLRRSRPTIQRYTLCRKGRLLQSRLNTICFIPPVNLRYDWRLLKGSSSWAIIHTWYLIFLTLLSLRTQFFTTGYHFPYSSLHTPFSNYT